MTGHKREIVVIGGGLSGYAVALGMALEGFETALVAPSAPADRRSTALIGSSLPFLERLDVLAAVRERAAPLATMRIVDDTGRLLRAPTVEFRAAEIGVPAFGYNVLNAELLAAMKARADELSHALTTFEAPAVAVSQEAGSAAVVLADGTAIRASLVVAADGRRSIARDAAGIRQRQWSYPQTAIVLNFAHEFAHQGVSTEFHTPTGPFTQVPLPGRRSSLVWVEKPEIAELLIELPPERLAEMIEAKMHSILGKIEIEGGVQAFPLRGAVADRLAEGRVALVGEAAHVFPPIGAQGLNLGLRDAAALVEAVATRRDDPGHAGALKRYERSRAADIATRTAGVHALNRSLLTDFLPVQAARSLVLASMAGFPALRRFAMREGAVPNAGLFGLPSSIPGSFDA